MEKTRSSPLASLFPWLSPLEIKFAWGEGGIEIQLYKNNRPRKNWHPSQLHRVLPLQLIKWIEDYHMHTGPRPYPLVKQLWQQLTPLASKKLIIDSSILAELEEVDQPQDLALIWSINHSSECIEGRYEGADRYLGMGWFQKGTKVWLLKNNPSDAIDAQLRNLVIPVQQADYLLSSIVPHLQQYLPTRANFQVISNFAVRVLVSNAQNGKLTLLLQSNYPQVLPIVQVLLQPADTLLANQAIIRFPHQALTSVLIQLLRSSSSITLQGSDVPQFISEQLPVMRHFYQISDDMAEKITQSNPIVSIATLRPTFSFIHTYESGIGKYTMTATYQYQQRTLDISALLAARRQNQRFVQQHSVWFEWPYDSRGLVDTILQQRAPQVLRPEEVMGFDTRRTALLEKQPIASAVQARGATPFERGESLFKQLRNHGIPGGVVGEPKELVKIFIKVCEYVLRDNRQARILWLAPSTKKGSVTRAIHGSTIGSYVTVTSLVTLRDEPALLSRPWTLVIFHGLNLLLLDESMQSRMLPQLKWHWALISVTSQPALHPSIMRVLHLSEQYYGQFCARYLFDLAKNYDGALPASTHHGSELNQKKIVQLHEESEQVQDRLTIEERQRTKALDQLNMALNKQIQVTMDSAYSNTSKGQSLFTSRSAPTSSASTASTGQQGPQIFIEKRVAVMKKYWYHFDKIHARQQTGMKPLWGLVEDSRAFDFEHRFRSSEPYQHQLYLQLLPSTIINEIEQLWGATMLPRWPERIISEPFPHKLFAEAFGQALKFWHGCALTAWFFCEGPSSRTNLAGLAEYYSKDVQALREMDTPINERLFEELVRAEKRLGQPQPFTRRIATGQGKFGITITTTTSYGTRREGFEKLRDIISFYRRQWAERYLDLYLQKCWKIEIQEAVYSCKNFLNKKDIPLTFKQFANEAKAATNHWFGGDISELYKAIQEHSPIQTQRVSILPADRTAFAFAVFKKLRALGNHASEQKNSLIDNSQYYQLNRLAAFSFWYVQLEEALGHTPALSNFGSSKFGQYSKALNIDINKAWDIFSSAIEEAKRAFPAPKVAQTIQPSIQANSEVILKPQKDAEQLSTRPIPAPVHRPIVRLDSETISKLHEESEHLRERLSIEDEEQEQPPVPLALAPEPAGRETTGAIPDVDEEWQIILQSWQSEHWELLRLLCQEKSVQLAVAERKAHRPLSLVIDEINAPVEERLGDLLVDPETQMLSPHLHAIAANMVLWYFSSTRNGEALS